MATITDIEQQKRRETRVSVYLDGDFWTGMPADLCALLNLTIGQEITDERRQEIEGEVGESAGLEAAMNLLSYRDRSESEMRGRLTDKGYGDGVVEAVIRRLLEYGYLNDEHFARQVVEGQQMKGRGRRAAEMALRKAGVDGDEAREALDAAYPSENEDDVAYDWASRRRVDVNTPEGRQKLTRQLAGRGFSFDVAKQVIMRLRDETDE